LPVLDWVHDEDDDSTYDGQREWVQHDHSYLAEQLIPDVRRHDADDKACNQTNHGNSYLSHVDVLP
jgi:hypothetical protein